jgi:hypothetical protein
LWHEQEEACLMPQKRKMKGISDEQSREPVLSAGRRGQ